MTTLTTTGTHGGDTRAVDYDAIVIGAGFGGIYMLHKLRNELGLTVRAFEKGGGVGGTWYFNRYPGAKSDTEGFVYRYSFDKDLLQDYDWPTRYLDQPDILAYLEPRRRPLRPAPRHPAGHRGHRRRVRRGHRRSGPSRPPTARRSPPATWSTRSACSPRATCPTSPAATPSPARWCTPTPGRRTSTSPASGSA